MLFKKLTLHEEKRLYTVKSYILNHLEEPLTVKELARMAGMNEQKFRDGFYLLFKMYPGEFVHETRMLTARYLLIHTGEAIKNIAGSVGYKRANNFIRAFKKFFGVTPSSVR